MTQKDVDGLLQRPGRVVALPEEAQAEIASALARVEKAEADASQERTWRQQYMELADKLEQQRDTAQADRDALRAERDGLRRHIELLISHCNATGVAVIDPDRNGCGIVYRVVADASNALAETRKGTTP